VTALDTPILTLPPRELSASPQWRIDDTVLVDGKRWIIRALNRRTGAVELSSANTVNVDIWWRTTLDKLPEKVR
jgi:hypothetical protein